MFASKITLTEETKNKMKKGMSIREKGKVLFARLQELDADGTLSKAQTRADVARLVGYSEERATAGYAWVSNLIRRGHISETLRKLTPNGKMVAEYHTTGSMPDYGYEEMNRRKTEKKAVQELRRSQAEAAAKYIPLESVLEHCATPPVIERARVSNPIKIKITRGDMSIEIEMDGYEQASKLITTVLKGDAL